MIARIQQTVVFLILAGLGAWVWQILPDYSRIYMPFMALAGVYIAYIAILFIVIHHLNRTDSQPRATLWALLQACLREASTAPGVFLWRQPFRTQAIPDFNRKTAPLHLSP
jgi:triacylglycerol lipase